MQPSSRPSLPFTLSPRTTNGHLSPDHNLIRFTKDMPRAVAGVLVECDQAIKATLVKIDQEHRHKFIIEDIDDQHLLIHSKEKDEFKELLDEVGAYLTFIPYT